MRGIAPRVTLLSARRPRLDVCRQPSACAGGDSGPCACASHERSGPRKWPSPASAEAEAIPPPGRVRQRELCECERLRASEGRRGEGQEGQEGLGDRAASGGRYVRTGRVKPQDGHNEPSLGRARRSVPVPVGTAEGFQDGCVRSPATRPGDPRPTTTGLRVGGHGRRSSLDARLDGRKARWSHGW